MIHFLLLLLGVAGSSNAATCFEGEGKAPIAKYAWELRNEICSLKGCAKSDATQLPNFHYCSIKKKIDDKGTYVQFERADPSGKYQYWQVTLKAPFRP